MNIATTIGAIIMSDINFEDNMMHPVSSQVFYNLRRENTLEKILYAPQYIDTKYLQTSGTKHEKKEIKRKI